MLAYTFALVGQIATVTPVAATGGPLLIDEVLVAGDPLLEHSQDGGLTFSTDWDDATPGTQTLAANTASTINLTLAAGAGSSVTLGDLASPASNIFALVDFIPSLTPANNSLTIDDRSSTHAGGVYDFFGTLGTITGPGGAGGGINCASTGPVHSFLIEGGPAGNTFNIHSTFDFSIVQTTIIGGADADTANVLGDTVPAIGTPLSIDLGGGSNTVHIGNGNLGATILAPVTVTDTGGNTSLDLDNQSDTTNATATLDNLSGNASAPFEVTGLSSGAIQYGSGVTALNINGGAPAAGVTYNVNNTQAGTTTTINGGASSDTFNLSPTAKNLSNLAGPVVINGNGGTNRFTLDDQNGAGGTYDIGGTTITAPGFGGLTYGTISSLTLNSSNAASTIDVDNTSLPTTLNAGMNADTLNVYATGSGAPLTIHGTDGLDTVNIGLGSVAGILGTVTVDNAASFTAIKIDASTDTTGHNAMLSGASSATLSGVAPANIVYHAYDTRSLSLTMGHASPSNSNNLTLDFTSGNPIPFFDPIGLIYNAGSGAANTLTLQGNLPGGSGGPGFASEVHNGHDPIAPPTNGQYGSIAFVDQNTTSTKLTYAGLTPINDTANAANYTFNDIATDPSFSAQNGPLVLGLHTIQFVNLPAVPPPTFETTNVANKTNIVFNTTTTTAGVNGIVNITAPSTGLASLTFNTPTGQDNTVSFVKTPPGVVTSLVGGSGEDVTNVTGKGVAAGTVLFLDGGAGLDTLNYDAGGVTPTVTAGLLAGEVLISIPGAGTVDAVNYEQINISHVAPVVITPGPAVFINSVEGFRRVDTLVGTFTAPIPIPGPGGFPASSFTASIDWGDPSVDPAAGTITQDASAPSVYYITGTHTFVDTGVYVIQNTVAFAGGTTTAPVDGVPVSFSFGPAGPTAGTPATAVVTQGPLAVSAFPIVGTEGVAVAAGPIATFIDAGGADPVGDYSATITVTDATGAVQFSSAAASITQNADASQYTVNAPGFTLPEEGNYKVVVSVTDDGSADPITVQGATTAIIADAKLSPAPIQPTVSTTEAPRFSVPVFGKPAFNGPVGSFTDGNLAAPSSDFMAMIDWGDGTPLKAGRISQPGGAGQAFVVSGAHTYADSGVNGGAGTYPIQVFIQDTGGSRLTLTNTATVADIAINLTGRLNIASDSGWYKGDKITNVTQPNFYGLSEPYSDVTLFANGTYDGATQAGSDGSWSITSNYLADGNYTITASAVDQFGVTTTASPVTIVPNLVIDTVGPRITFVSFDARHSTATFVFQDLLVDGTTPGGSGLLYRTLFDAANYSLTKVPGRAPGSYIVTNLHILPGPNPFSQEVILVFNNGAYNKKGGFELMARAASVLQTSGIQDVAGNALDGEFYGKWTASGNGMPGGNFVADFSVDCNKAPKGPSTIIGYSHPSPAPPSTLDPPAKKKVVTDPVKKTAPLKLVTAPVKKATPVKLVTAPVKKTAPVKLVTATVKTTPPVMVPVPPTPRISYSP